MDVDPGVADLFIPVPEVPQRWVEREREVSQEPVAPQEEVTGSGMGKKKGAHCRLPAKSKAAR